MVAGLLGDGHSVVQILLYEWSVYGFHDKNYDYEMGAKESGPVRGCTVAPPALSLDAPRRAGGSGPREPDSGTVTDVDVAGGGSRGLTLPATWPA